MGSRVYGTPLFSKELDSEHVSMKLKYVIVSDTARTQGIDRDPGAEAYVSLLNFKTEYLHSIFWNIPHLNGVLSFAYTAHVHRF